MPPKKRGLTDGDSNAQPPKKRTSTSASNDKQKNNSIPIEDDSDSDSDSPTSISNRPKDFYITIQKPPYLAPGPDGKGENLDMFNLPASEHPTWPYVLQTGTWIRLADLVREATYRDPDNFDLNVYTDDHAYGIFELLENVVIDYVAAKKQKGFEGLQERWRIIAALGHWLNHDDKWISIDDGERTGQAADVIGAALLSTLDEMDREGELKAESKFRDLGLVMALYLKWSIYPAEIPIEEVKAWQPHVVGYAKKAGIDLAEQGVERLEDVLKEYKEVEAMEGEQDWQSTKKLEVLKPTGGEKYVYPLWTRQQRKAASFTGKDPLQDLNAKELKDGVRDGSLMIA